MKNFNLFRDLVKKSKTIFISTHVLPDADGIGAQITLYLAFKKMGKKVYCINQETLSGRYQFIDPKKIIMSASEFKQKKINNGSDLFIIVDANSTSRVGHKLLPLIEKSKRVLYIDHHPVTDSLSTLHCIDPTISSTGEIVKNFITKMKVEITQEMAMALYSSIIVDTNSFRYPSVNKETFKYAHDLLKTGIRPHTIYNDLYGNKRVEHLRLLGEVLKNAKLSENETIAWMTIKKSLLQKYNAHLEDVQPFINQLLILKNVKVAIMFQELPNKIVKVGLRSKGEINVSDIAETLGGGGHYHSAAVLCSGTLASVTKRVIKEIEKIIAYLKSSL